MYAVLAGEIIDQALKSTMDDTRPVSKHTNHTSNLAILSNNYQGFIQDFFLGGGTLVCGKVDQLQP